MKIVNCIYFRINGFKNIKQPADSVQNCHNFLIHLNELDLASNKINSKGSILLFSCFRTSTKCLLALLEFSLH